MKIAVKLRCTNINIYVKLKVHDRGNLVDPEPNLITSPSLFIEFLDGYLTSKE